MTDEVLNALEGVRASEIVGWVVWDDAENRYSSLDIQADDLPASGIQVVLLYYFDPTGSRYPDGKRYLRRLACTGYDTYKIPRGDGTVRSIRGDWTTLVNHDRICDQAFPEWWPRS